MTINKNLNIHLMVRSTEEKLPWGSGIAFAEIHQSLAGRRTSRRFRVKQRLLAVCEAYSGEIFDISRTGFSFQIVHVRKEGEKVARKIKPDPSRTVDIFSPGNCRHLFKDLEIEVVVDRYVGPLYTDNGRVLLFRRSVRFAKRLTERQMDALKPYLGCDPEHLVLELPAGEYLPEIQREVLSESHSDPPADSQSLFR